MLKGGWWWKSCGRGLNGIYLTDPQDLTARQGIIHANKDWENKKKKRKKDGDCSLTFRVSPRHRYRLVPLARMGLYSQTGHDDDPPATLRQRAVDAQSSRENFQIIMGKKVEKFYHNIKRKISANQIHNETIADSISVCPQFSIRSLQLQYYSHYPKTNRKNWI